MTTPVRRPDAPRRRHLLDPAHLAESHARTQSTMGQLTRVQQWVMSVLAVTTILHFAAGLVIAAVFLESDDRGSQIGLCVIAAVVGVLAVAAGFAIHKRRPLTPWLALGLLPGLIGMWICLR